MSLTQLSQLLPLPIEDLQQILDYTRTLSSDEAADHLNNLLGQSSQTTKFISDFNLRLPHLFSEIFKLLINASL